MTDKLIEQLEKEKAKLEANKEKIDAIKAKLKEIEKRKRVATAKQKRKDDNRRKILLGACTLNEFEHDFAFRNDYYQRLDRYLTADRDRKLFDLPLRN